MVSTFNTALVTTETTWFTVKSPTGKLLRKYVRTNRRDAIRAAEFDLGRDWKGINGLQKSGYRSVKISVKEN